MCYTILLLVCAQYWLIYSYHSVFLAKQSKGLIVQNKSERTPNRIQIVGSIDEEEMEWDEGEVPWDFVEQTNKTSAFPSSKIPVLKGLRFSKNELEKIIYLII